MPRVKSGTIELEYVMEGSHSQDVVVLSTGFGDQMTFWPRSLRRALIDAGFSVVSFDTRDVGLSTEAVGYGLDDLAGDLLAIIEAIDVPNVHVLGYSMGGQIALRTALRGHPALTSLALVFTTSGAPELPGPNAVAVRASLAVTCRSDYAAALDAQLALMRLTSGPLHPYDDFECRAAAQTALARAYRPEGTSRHLQAMVSAMPVHEQLKRIAIPSLVFQATDDCFFAVEHGRDLADRLEAELVLVEGAGHNLSESVGHIIAAPIANFLQEQRKRHAQDC